MFFLRGKVRKEEVVMVSKAERNVTYVLLSPSGGLWPVDKISHVLDLVIFELRGLREVLDGRGSKRAGRRERGGNMG